MMTREMQTTCAGLLRDRTGREFDTAGDNL